VQRASGVPHALFGREIFQRLGRFARRDANVCLAVRVFSRHCERSEAIHSSFTRRDGLLRFARNDGLRAMAQHGAPHSQSSSPANGSAEWPPCVLPLQSAHEAAGATGIRRSPRPLLGGRFFNGSGASRRGFANVCLAVIASAAKQSILPLRGKMDCFASLAMTAGSRRIASRSLSSGGALRGPVGAPRNDGS
jgi:hypothetical protein